MNDGVDKEKETMGPGDSNVKSREKMGQSRIPSSDVPQADDNIL